MSNELSDGIAALIIAARRHSVNLSVLVAETALWANPNIHRQIAEKNGTGAMYPQFRRNRSGEKDGPIVEGIKLDSNVYAQQAMKRATGLKLKPHSYHTCHIWPDSCYDPRYYTVVANLVFLPSAIAGLSDHFPEVRSALQYRSFELYNWYPVEQPMPVRPESYPTNWQEPIPIPKALLRSLSVWPSYPHVVDVNLPLSKP